MPAEAARLRHRMRRRDRWFLASLATAAVLGTLPAVVLAGRSGRSEPRASCIETTRAWIMGAITIKKCGADAVSYCRQTAREDAAIAAKCERLGVSAAPRRNSRP
jgi:hypothetical protein